MRILPCLLLTCSVIATDAQAQTAIESQDAAVAAIRKLGGTVTFDKKNPGMPVFSVFLHRTKITDAGMEHLRALKSLKTLNLFNTEVSDAGLLHLKGLTKLQSLNLYNTVVTDAGLVHLKGLTSLKRLSLANTKVTDAGVKKLQAALPECKIRR